jgi:hypothetical protein
VFLTHAGPIALDYFRKPGRAKARSLSRAGGARSRKDIPTSVEHVIALDYEKTRPNVFAKALASWRARAVQSSARKAS